MKSRLLTGCGFILILALAFILKFFVSNYFFDAAILAVACFCAYEASQIFNKTGKYNDKILATIYPGFLMIVSLIFINLDTDLGILYTISMAIMTLAVFFLVAYLLPLIFFRKTKEELKTRKLDKQYTVSNFALKKAFNSVLVCIYPSFLLLFMTFINHFEDMPSSFAKISGQGGFISLFVLLLTFLIPILTDTFAYVVGKIIGGKKLAPKVSPNKTIAGAVGGLVMCVLVTIVTFLIFNAVPSLAAKLADCGITLWKIVIISIISSCICQAGDLFESYLKRSAGVKDSGKILPGHGGMLDRFDSYIFLAPFIFMAFSILFAVL